MGILTNASDLIDMNSTLDNYNEIKNSVLCVSAVFSFVSACSALFMLTLLTERNIAQLPRPSRRLFRYLTYADFLTAFGNFVGIMRYIIRYKLYSYTFNDCEYEVLCVIQSLVTTFSTLSSFMWTLIIAIFFVLKVVQRDIARQELFLRMSGYFHTLCWGVPAIISLMAVTIGVLGEDTSWTSGGWCWITSCTKDWSVWQRFALGLWTGKLWEIGVYISVVVISIHLLFTIRHQNRHNQWDFQQGGLRNVAAANQLPNHPQPLIEKEEKIFIVMPCFLALIRLPGTIRFLISTYLYFSHTSSHHLSLDINKFLQNFQGSGDSSQALCNFLLLLKYSKSTRHHLLRLITCGLCGEGGLQHNDIDANE